MIFSNQKILGENMTTPQWALERIQEVKEKKYNSLNLSRGDSSTLEPLVEIPGNIFELVDLTSLILGGNRIAELPESIAKLKNLELLDLSLNKLIDLPESISELKKLQTLYLEGNNIVVLPRYVVELQNLRSLFLSGNQLLTPPNEVAARGVEAIREYFRQLEEQGQDRLYEAKMLILGEPGAGKTTLAKKIQDPNYILQDEKTTEGVDVNAWLFPVDDDKLFRVNLWDFGGQEIYHATHQFFLTKRSLYVLVADTRKEDTDFYYWLSVVELLSDNSPLLVVKNEKQDRHREINERQLRGQFENLKAILSVNLATSRGLEKLNSEIKHYVKTLPHIGSPLPKTWVRVREILEKDSRNYISTHEYLSICRENGFLKIKDSLQLSSYLHDIGVFLHFQEDTFLKKIVILKPKWGTSAAYEVLDNKEVVRHLGRFTRDDLNVIWNAPEYENMQDELLQLMMKFKLCYEVPGSNGVFVAPQLLTENQPVYGWNEEDSLQLRYTYEFMPKGILLKLIVALNNYIVTVGSPLVWRSGLVIMKDKTVAEIVEYYGKREIRMRVTGPHKKALMTIVMYELDIIHAAYSKRLKYDRLISCNCTECRLVSKNPYFYRFETLQRFTEDKQEEIQCQQSYRMVNVRSLIDDVIGVHEKRLEENATEEKRLALGGINIGDNFSGTFIAGVARNSFNKIERANISSELKEILKQLVEAVDVMKKSMPEGQASEISDDLDKLVDEATKTSPRRKWYSVSIEGLIAAAENLDKLGEPVISLSRKVLSLLTAGVIK